MNHDFIKIEFNIKTFKFNTNTFKFKMTYKFESECKINNAICDMLKEISINIDYDSHLSDKQKVAFELFKQEKNLFIHGYAGSGKSLLINTFENYTKSENKHKNIYITSTTGISAHHIGGTTINSLFGVGTGDGDINKLIKNIMFKQIYKNRIVNMDILIIDEISMLSAKLFEKLDIICQKIRKNKKFFGGIQVILTGDFMQLSPVFNNKFNNSDDDTRILIESPVFNNEFNKKNKNIIILNKNFRQNDPTFINILMNIRSNTYTDHDISILNNRKLKNGSDVSHYIHLVSSNKKAQAINENKLSKLPDPIYTFNAIYKKENSKSNDDETSNLIIKELQYQFKQKNIESLSLKKGARVMLIKNLDISLGLVNGSLGTVTNIHHNKLNKTFLPEITFDNKVKKIIDPVSWELENDNCKCSATQIPLMLAYACTIHKSQGQTLQNAVLDLEDAFCDHMVYVALSRVVSLDGVFLKSFNPSKIKINTKLKSYIDNIE